MHKSTARVLSRQNKHSAWNNSRAPQACFPPPPHWAHTSRGHHTMGNENDERTTLPLFFFLFFSFFFFSFFFFFLERPYSSCKVFEFALLGGRTVTVVVVFYLGWGGGVFFLACVCCWIKNLVFIIMFKEAAAIAGIIWSFFFSGTGGDGERGGGGERAKYQRMVSRPISVGLLASRFPLCRSVGKPFSSLCLLAGSVCCWERAHHSDTCISAAAQDDDPIFEVEGGR